MRISEASNKRDFAASIIDGTPTMEDIVQMVAELEYREEIELYQLQRRSEYPELGAQLDYIYHNGVDAWKTDIVDPVKNKYAKVSIDADELASRRAIALAEYQLEEYSKAITRLQHCELAVGIEEATEEIVIGIDETTSEEITEIIVTQEAVQPVDATVEVRVESEDGETFTIETIENPLITKDNQERAAAQAIVDATPQAVIDTYNE